MDNELRTKRQIGFAYTWWKYGGRNTIKAVTGIGKNFTAIRCMLLALTEPFKMRMVDGKMSVLHLAEVTDRKNTFEEELVKFEQIFNIDIKSKINITYGTYQYAYRKDNTYFDFVIADEVTDSLTPSYSKYYFNNKYVYLAAFTATDKANVTYELDDNVKITKRRLLQKIAPICIDYTPELSFKDGLSRRLVIHVFNNKLDTRQNLLIKGKYGKKQQFMSSEQGQYNYLDDKIRMLPHLTFYRNQRARILYTLPSKQPLVEKILEVIKGQTILFGCDINTLLKITPNVVCSRYSTKKNNSIKEAFNNEEFKTIGSFKKLKQGENLKNLTNAILHSYFSNDGDFIQRVGRLRQDGDTLGHVFMLRTVDTEEEKWFKNKVNPELYIVHEYNTFNEFLLTYKTYFNE